MSACPLCGSVDTYDSGFTFECPTRGCKMFSEKQAKAASSAAKIPNKDKVYVLNTTNRWVGYNHPEPMLAPGGDGTRRADVCDRDPPGPG